MQNNQSFWIGVATIVTLCVVVLTVRVLAEVPDFFGISLCKGDDCSVQAWLSALSGYVALVAALIGIRLTWSGLREQRAQTRFMVGDSLPTMAVTRYGDDYPGRLVIRLTNWNRRAIEPHGLLALMDDVEIQVTEIDFAAKNFKQSWRAGPIKGARINRKIVIPGWEDRSAAPYVTEIIVNTRDPKHATASVTKILQVRLAVEIYGERVEAVELATEGPVMA